MSASVDNKIIGTVKPSIKAEEVISVFSTYTEGVEKISKEVVQHAAGQFHRNSETFMTWMHSADPMRRIEIAQTWMLDSAKGYHSMLHSIASIGHETVGQMVKNKI